jgi:hypothetical protein
MASLTTSIMSLWLTKAPLQQILEDSFKDVYQPDNEDDEGSRIL